SDGLSRHGVRRRIRSRRRHLCLTRWTWLAGTADIRRGQAPQRRDGRGRTQIVPWRTTVRRSVPVRQYGGLYKRGSLRGRPRRRPIDSHHFAKAPRTASAALRATRSRYTSVGAASETVLA